ncbi:hypothetical protein TWF730_007068 [Orbilia blumenaviensis]|uniref:Uncharacterized protein n=1 Tax=Orbilia blumenaviensis TaxID=1796055 RepID=A0AAV9VGM5_9PEZI
MTIYTRTYLPLGLALYFAIIGFAIPVNLPFLRFDSFSDLLDDLNVLHTDIQTQKIRPDLTGKDIQKLIAETKALEREMGSGSIPPYGLVAKAVMYFDFVRNLTEDFPLDIPASLGFLDEDWKYGPGKTKEILETAAEEVKQTEEEELLEEDGRLFVTPPETGYFPESDIKENEFHTAVSDPGFDAPSRNNDRVAGGGERGIGAKAWADVNPVQRYDNYEEEKQGDSVPRRVVRNLYEEEFKEEQMDPDQSSDDSNSDAELLWYRKFLGSDSDDDYRTPSSV